MVLRWEYRPGSTLYVVWTQGRDHYVGDGEFGFGADVQQLFAQQPDNVLMVKASYWFSP